MTKLSNKNSMMIGLIRKSVFFVSLILIWVLVSKLNIWPSYIFPSPYEALDEFILGFTNGTLVNAIKSTMFRLTIGYSISLVIGLFIGVLLARFKWLDDTLGSLVLGLQTLPSVCWVPLAILWFGLEDTTIYFVLIMGAVSSIIISTKFGIMNVSPIYLKTARTMGVKGLKAYTQVTIPAALPSIVNGLKLGWSFAWRSLMAAEIVTAGIGGLGNQLQNGRDYKRMGLVITVMIIILVIGLLVDKIVFAFIEKKIEEKWGLQKT